MEKSTVRLKLTRLGQHSTTPLSVWSSYDNQNRVCSSRVMELPKVAKNSPRVASEKQHGTKSENAYNFPIIDTFGCYFWKAISPEASNSGTPKLGLEVRRGHTINRSPHPLPLIYTYVPSTLIIPAIRIYITYSSRPSCHAVYWLTLCLLHIIVTYWGYLEGTLEHQNLHAGLSAMYITRLYFGKFEKHISELPRKVLFSFLKCCINVLPNRNIEYTLVPSSRSPKETPWQLQLFLLGIHHRNLYTYFAIFTILAQDSKSG